MFLEVLLGAGIMFVGVLTGVIAAKYLDRDDDDDYEPPLYIPEDWTVGLNRDE